MICESVLHEIGQEHPQYVKVWLLSNKMSSFLFSVVFKLRVLLSRTDANTRRTICNGHMSACWHNNVILESEMEFVRHNIKIS